MLINNTFLGKSFLFITFLLKQISIIINRNAIIRHYFAGSK